jgi:hypothetical protein
MLVGNFSVVNKAPYKCLTGANNIFNRANFNTPGSSMGVFTCFDKLSAEPLGYLPPYSWMLPLKSGGMASFTLSEGEISATSAILYEGRNLSSTVNLTITVTNAQADSIVAMVGSGTLVIQVDNASLSAGVSAIASAILEITSSAELGGIFDVTAASSMVISPNVDMSALAFMDADAGGPTDLSPEGLANAVLESEIEPGFDLQSSLKLILTAVAGKLSGAPGTTITIRNVQDDKSRIVATVDTNGNRSSITYDIT